MRRAVLLSTLTPGRCFTLAEPPPALDEGSAATPDPVPVRQGRAVMEPEQVWKVVAAADDGVSVQSAAGADDRLEAGTLVVEVPRQGFDRLAQRVREEAAR